MRRHEPSYSQVVDRLSQAGIAVRELSGDGHVAVMPAAGRIVAMAFSRKDANLFWSNPEKLADGGDRLWFAPELPYHWDGQPDWQSFANYKVPPATDPGAYQFLEQAQDEIALHAKGKLPIQGTTEQVGFEVTRRIRLAPPPLPKTDPLMKGVEYVGIETSHTLRLSDETRSGSIDLWHLLQIPAGSVLIVPLRKAANKEQVQPLSYGLLGHWESKPDHIFWRYGGEAKAKFGLPAAALTGRSAVLRQIGPGRWCAIVRQFSVDPKARYADHPYGIPRNDQAFQAWDGFGFGEMEFHSPMLDAQAGSRELEESDQLWAFAGQPLAIATLASRLLDVDVGYVVK